MGRIAFLVEGIREVNYFECLRNTFFPKSKFDIICLPSEQNIYMLWSKLKEDDFQTDIIELVRECSEDAKEKLSGCQIRDFEEIYLFFDFDAHQNNLKGDIRPSDVLEQMLDTFNNETDIGKLYISYPMIEALRDVSEWVCTAHYRCYVSIEEYKRYKELSGENSRFSQVEKYSKDDWHMIIAIFLARYCCLVGKLGHNTDYSFCLQEYKKSATPENIFNKIMCDFNQGKGTFVLSALPAFLIDYFKSDYWGWIKNIGKNVSYPSCELYKAPITETSPF